MRFFFRALTILVAATFQPQETEVIRNGIAKFRSRCEEVDFKTFQKIRHRVHHARIGPKGYYLDNADGCYFTEVESTEFRAKYPEDYDTWSYVMRVANGEVVEQMDADKVIRAPRGLDRQQVLNIALVTWFILSQIFPRWI
ncbi:uncharacterized protein PAC_17416 [Phialocephala subalpina]|uniref:Uncharacterized protein n=1 Tax=Phialocephala subalpina TaxID=576137 RepID=A0A1L7XRF7_9HELO|nr:uncharacterized protein PAC_17416 [Phialocephala subalpina]